MCCKEPGTRVLTSITSQQSLKAQSEITIEILAHIPYSVKGLEPKYTEWHIYIQLLFFMTSIDSLRVE